MRKSIVLMGTFLLAGAVLFSRATASNVQPGSQGDPVVSKSNVDERINQVMQMMTTGQTQVTGSVPEYSSVPAQAVDRDEIINEVMGIVTDLYGDGTASASKFIPVVVYPGQVVAGEEGSEIILRSGSAVGYCPGDNGLVDMTDGREIGNGEEIKTNHLIIVPRFDGRGVRTTSEAWFIIRGGYDLR